MDETVLNGETISIIINLGKTHLDTESSDVQGK